VGEKCVALVAGGMTDAIKCEKEKATIEGGTLTDAAFQGLIERARRVGTEMVDPIKPNNISVTLRRCFFGISKPLCKRGEQR